METIYLDVYGIRVRVASDTVTFLEFLKEHYLSFIDLDVQEPQLQVNISLEAGKFARKQAEKLPEIGAGLRVTRDEVYWENPFGFCVHVADRGNWSVNAYHFDLIDCDEPSRRYENYQRCMRWAIHFPVFSLLSLHQGKHIIHASALGKDNSALLFTGLNGVGKSTLAAYLATVYDFQFLSDNFALFDDQRIFPFPERLRLSQQSFEILGRDNPINSPTIYGKIQVSPPPVSQDGYSPLFCFLLRKGASPRISRLSPEVVPQLKESLDHYLKEYPAYSYLGVWLGLRGDGLEAGREDSAVFKCPWFIVDIHHTGNLSKTAEEILECTSTFRI